MSRIRPRPARIGCSRQIYDRPIQVLITAEDAWALDAACKRYDCTLSNLIRHAFRQYLAAQGSTAEVGHDR